MYTTKDICFEYTIFKLSQPFSHLLLIDKLKEYNRDTVIFQLIDPKYLVSSKQIEVAIFHTMKAFERNVNKARDKGTELLLWLAGKRQIDKALQIFGLSEHSEYLLLLCITSSSTNCKQELQRFEKELDNNAVRSDLKLPLTEKETLAEFYETTDNLENLEKKSMETMAQLALE